MNRRIIPPPLQKGAHIRVIAPAGPSKPEMLQHGIDELKRIGYRVSCSTGCLETPEKRPQTYLAADDDCRANDLIHSLCKTDSDAVMITRGGYGTTRILDRIPFPGVEKKWFTGFSDLTALSLALYEKRRLITLSGPIVAGSLKFSSSGTTMQSWQNWVTDAHPQSYNVTIQKSGQARGVLLGGCLTLMIALLGTRYSPSYQNAILLLEDIREEDFRVDRMLTQLALAGVFRKVAGVVVGEFCDDDGTPQAERSEFAAQRILELVGHRRIPVVSGFPYGHYSERVTVPIGGDAIIHKNTVTLSLPERKL